MSLYEGIQKLAASKEELIEAIRPRDVQTNEWVGDLGNTAGMAMLGLGAGAAFADENFGSGEIAMRLGVPVLGAVAGAALPNLIGHIAASIADKRTAKEQLEHDKDTPSAIGAYLKTLIPGYYKYQRLQREKVLEDLEKGASEEEKKKVKRLPLGEFDQGFNKGHDNGFNKGYNAGYNEGYEAAMRELKGKK